MSPDNEASDRDTKKGSLPPADFSGFIVSLAQAAAIHLGEVPDPSTGVKSRNIAQARYSIDLLDMIAEKTRGNLDTEEQMLIERLRSDLKIMFVRASKSSAGVKSEP